MNNVLFVIAFGLDGLMHICRTFSETRKKTNYNNTLFAHIFPAPKQNGKYLW